ncbi:penicillin acylase family protein [Patulibacter sp.]|uniref:penicillin acylase family protein n=1 Tax=Patulibacter sp. TaxID=1912859 RepID=UPI002717A900|nr:penicillin acylase family protein [Patulibacter sp.]MDO9408976.1 penicillin acylase family protein [Patulibacter sp.]
MLAACSAGPAGAAPTPAGPGAGDTGGGTVREVLPPGSAGGANVVDILGNKLIGPTSVPDHGGDQLSRYAALPNATPGLTAGRLPEFFTPAGFGVASGDVESSISPRPDVTIVRDKGVGVPHITGSTRAGLEFGAGYANAQDRLFLMDALRHVGRAQLSSLAGGAPGNRAFDAQVWAFAPYTEQDRVRQFEQLDDLYGAEGAQVQTDIRDYIDGINRYIADARAGGQKLPGEYALLGHPGGPDPFTTTDVVSIATIVGSQFGAGGGAETDTANVLQALQQKLGTGDGLRLWRQLMAFDDPDAPTTIHPGADATARKACAERPADLKPARTARGRLHRARRCPKGADAKRSATWFPYQRPVSAPDAIGTDELLPDTGSIRLAPVTADDSFDFHGNPVRKAATRGAAAKSATTVPRPTDGLFPGGIASSMSNALLVPGSSTTTGRPLAVFGPQTSYFSPQILVQQELQGPGISARGATFPGVGMYVEIGRGTDYAWSATSGNEDVTDTFVLPVCDPGGGTPKDGGDHYLYRGTCTAIEQLRTTSTWAPSLGDSTPAGSITYVAQRTKLGIVRGRARVGGKPVLLTQLRTTYMHEADSAIGFKRFNEPAAIRDAKSFQAATEAVGYTFNWFYVDDRDAAMITAGWLPQRPAKATGQVPIDGAKPWADWNPDTWVSARLPATAHPQRINGQGYITSWNNRQAPGFAGSDTSLFSSVYRSQILDRQLDLRLQGGAKVSLPQVVDAMSRASVTDLRGQELLPLALQVTGDGTDPTTRRAIALLRAWGKDGWTREDRDGDGRYDHAEAIRILDAWWPRWARAQFRPVLGAAAYDRLGTLYKHTVDDGPGAPSSGDPLPSKHQGSAYQNAWYGYAAKDLRTLLGQRVRQKYVRPFCGGGDREACKAALLSTLRDAVAVPIATTYPSDPICAKQANAKLDRQLCYDAIDQRSLGGLSQPMIPWQNRPTYQLVVGFDRHRPR